MPTIPEQDRKRKPGRPERRLKLHMTPEHAARAIFAAGDSANSDSQAKVTESGFGYYCI